MTQTDPFWNQIDQALDLARKAHTADELVAAVRTGPDQHAGDPRAKAFFAGSGGDTQLVNVLDHDLWRITWLEGYYRWEATATGDGSAVEYIEGDLYQR